MLESIRRLAAQASSGASSVDVAEAVAGEVITLLDADASILLRIEGDDAVMVGGKAVPGQRLFTRGTRFQLEDAMLSAEIRRTGQPSRASRYTDREGDAPRRVATLGYTTVIGAPVWVHERLWGTVIAATTEEDRLAPGSEHELEVFAGIFAVAIASGENVERLEAQAAEQEALLQVSRSVLELPAEDVVGAAIAREAATLLGLPSAALLRFADDGTITVTAEWHADPGGEIGHDDVGPLVRERREVVSVGDPDTTAPDDSRRALGRPLGWGAPIEFEGTLWGALVVAGEPGSHVPLGGVERLSRFAELASLAIARVEARAALISQVVETEQMAALVELSDDFIAIADLDGRCLYVNRGGRRLLGIASVDDVRDMQIMDFLTPEGIEQSFEVEQPAVRETGSWQGESTLRHFQTGEGIPVSINSFLVTHPITGEPLVLATVQRDLRERKRAELELRARADEVEQLAAARRFLLVEALRAEERMRRQIGDALHEQVLQELYAARQDLDEVRSDEEAVHRARVAVDAAGRQLRETVRDLHPAVSWTRDIDARLASILEQGEERGGFTAKLDFSASSLGDADDLVLALVRELVHNVVKHAQASQVTVAVRDDADGLSIDIADDGRGMHPARPLEALRGGHIGLASARERVEALGGRFTIDSEPGVGTRVHVLVPRSGLDDIAGPAA